MFTRRCQPFLPLAAVLFLVACGGGETTQETSADARLQQLGEQVYNNYCVTCHQANAQGVPNVYPTLHETEWVQGDKGRLIRLMLNGMQGPVEINGTSFNSVMTPHDFLSDEQIAAVLTYVRSNFNNEASAVTPDEVAVVRASNEQRGQWEASVLWETTGIPD